MSKVRAIITAALSYLSELSIPSIAVAVAGVAAPIVAGVLGADFSAAILTPYLVMVGGVAAVLDKILSGQPAPTPTPPSPPPNKPGK